MTSYIDASVLVAAIVREPFTPPAQALMKTSDELCASGWVLTEAVSALAIKQRTGQLTQDQRSLAQAAAETALEEMALAEILPRHFRKATRFIERSALPLRGGDALHLAIAQSANATFWTLNRKLVAAGQALALDVRLLA